MSNLATELREAAAWDIFTDAPECTDKVNECHTLMDAAADKIDAMAIALEQAEHWLQAEADSPEPGATKPDEILRVIREALKQAKGAPA